MLSVIHSLKSQKLPKLWERSREIIVFFFSCHCGSLDVLERLLCFVTASQRGVGNQREAVTVCLLHTFVEQISFFESNSCVFLILAATYSLLSFPRMVYSTLFYSGICREQADLTFHQTGSFFFLPQHILVPCWSDLMLRRPTKHLGWVAQELDYSLSIRLSTGLCAPNTAWHIVGWHIFVWISKLFCSSFDPSISLFGQNASNTWPAISFWKLIMLSACISTQVGGDLALWWVIYLIPSIFELDDIILDWWGLITLEIIWNYSWCS